MPKPCSHPDCTYPVFSKLLCVRHWLSSPYNKGIQQKKVSPAASKAARKPIPKVSTKQAKLNKAYSALRKVFLEQHPICMARVKCAGSLATDVHHIKSRGEYMLDTTEWMAICRVCHDWCHTNHAQAVALGLIKSKLHNND